MIQATSRSSEADFKIHVRPVICTILISCVLIEIIFFLLDAYVNFGRAIDIGAVRRLCNLAREDSLSSWFGSVQTLLVGFTLLLIFLRVRKDADTTKLRSAGWCVLAFFFIYLAIDDGAEVHERMGTVFKELSTRLAASDGEITIGKKLLELFPSYPWQILFLPIFSCMGLFMVLFLWRELSGWPARALMLAGITCFAVAVGIDFIEGMEKEHAWNIQTMIVTQFRLEKNTVRHFSKAIEETIELFGTTFLWTAFLIHLSRVAGKIQIRFVH